MHDILARYNIILSWYYKCTYVISSHFNSPLNSSMFTAWIVTHQFQIKSFQSNVLLFALYGASVLEHRPTAPFPLPFLSKDIYHT